MILIAEFFGDEPWKHEANCAGLDMYPEPVSQPGSSLSMRYTFSPEEMHAKRVCWNCPVREICLEQSFVKPEKYGVWGGLTEVQRADIIQVSKKSLELARKRASHQAQRESAQGTINRQQRDSRAS